MVASLEQLAEKNKDCDHNRDGDDGLHYIQDGGGGGVDKAEYELHKAVLKLKRFQLGIRTGSKQAAERTGNQIDQPADYIGEDEDDGSDNPFVNQPRNHRDQP